MDKCPPELHTYICQLTSVDDGYTIRSINQTSRYFYDISKPYLYQTLSISGPKQIRTIATLLESNSKAYLRRIRHLFISDTGNYTAEKHGHPHRTDLEIQNLTLRILSLAAPTLESLALVAYSPQTSTSVIARTFRTSFPRLRDLSICGFYPFPTMAGNFPRLERLHLNGNRNPYGLLQMSVLDNACPSLKSLKISGLRSAVTFAAEVLEAVINGEEEREESSILFPAKFPALLRRVALRAGPPQQVVNRAKESTGQLQDEVMMKVLEGLNTDTTSNRVQIILLGRSPESTIPVADIKQEWLETIRTLVS